MSDDVKRALEAAEADVMRQYRESDWEEAKEVVEGLNIAAAIAAFHRDMKRQADAGGEMATAGMHANIAAAVERAAREAGDE